MTNESLKSLGQLSIESFLKHYWQKQPVVLRQVFPQFKDPIKPEELAGLSLEDEIESRIIQFQPEAQQWLHFSGPHEEKIFLNLPDSHWTLLVQALEHWLPEAKSLLQSFRFIPDWRLDDLMVSYATPGGGVGPHVDQYDVFLIQGLGKRRWKVGNKDCAVDSISPHPQLKQVSHFNPVIDEVLESGDVLYIPPNTPHDGIAVEACLTYSVGFRAPSILMVQEQLLLDLLQSDEFSSQRYTDHDPIKTFQSSQLPSSLTQWLRQSLNTISDEQLTVAFGKLVTQTRHQEDESLQTLSEITEQLLKGNDDLGLPPNGRMTFSVNNNVLCFINGTASQFSLNYRPLIEDLCRFHKIERKRLNNYLQDIEFVNEIANLIYTDCLNFIHR